MVHIIVFFVIFLTSLLTGPALVHANKEDILPSRPGDAKVENTTSDDLSKNNADLKPQVSHNLKLHSFSIRGTFSSVDVIGDEAPEEFREYDIAASFNLPWAYYTMSGWGVSTRMMISAGALYNNKDTALAFSVIGQIVFGSKDGGFELDFGAGEAALSRHRFGVQDFGGPFQFALTAGSSIRLFKRYAVGYRYLHYSDAGLNGSLTTGADLHMFELVYRF